MDNYSILQSFLDKDEWVAAIDYLTQVSEKHPEDVDVAINLVYCFGIFLSEKAEMDAISVYQNRSIAFFEQAYERFRDNPDFLFYAGFMVCIGEWNYGIEDHFGDKMMAMALSMRPDDVVFSLGSDMEDRKQLKRHVFSYLDENGYESVLKHGPMGEYFLDCFRPKPYD